MKGFIKINFTAKTAEGEVFDTTDAKLAKELGLHIHDHSLKTRVIKVGERHLLPGMDKHLEALSIGKHKIILPPEEAFGKKSASLLKLVPTRVLKEHKINPYVGQPLEIDGHQGIVRVASGGRTIVDFNHPFAGQNIEYDIEILGEETDIVKQGEAILDLLHVHDGEVVKDEKGIIVLFKEMLPKQFTDILGAEMKRLLDVEIKIAKKENPKSK